ncbi:MAG TPA: AMIN domain-containing protein [Gemmatimonadaceae bacterium]|nr:AMIN domain-containing protein [Gemmatimonadaceae bacterium]
MRRNWKLTAAAAGALLIGASSAAAAPDHRSEAAAAVTAVSVIPGPGRADVVLSIDGDVRITDFTLEGPHRIVVDVEGATMDLGAPRYDRVSRAGILNVRIAQYRADVVRLVLDLDAAREYTVSRNGSDLRVSVVGPDAFAPWSAGVAAVVADAPPAQTAQPSAYEEPRFEPLSSVGPARPISMQQPQQTQEPRIDVSFANTDIKTVIATFAAFSGRTFITGSTVEGSVTAEISGQPWDIALSKILQANGLTAHEDSTGIITVDSYQNIAARVAAEPLVTQLVPVNYASASELAVAIRQLMATCSSAVGTGTGQVVDLAAAPGTDMSAAQAEVVEGGATAQTCGRGTVGVDAKTNTIIVTESVSRLPEIVGFIRDLDVRTPQVAIKAKIISVDRTATEELGLSYDVGGITTGASFNSLVPRGTTTEPYTIQLGGDAFAGIANANRVFSGTAALSLIYNTAVGGMNLASFLDALSSELLSDVQAEPSTTTIDNRTATLFAGTEIAFLLTPPSIPGQIQAVAPVIQRQKIGITLEVTPHVTANRQVSMSIVARQQSQLGVTVAGPEISERNATNEVLVGDGETAVIAGLTQTQVTRSRSGIPYLMDIPFIGRLFAQTRVAERKQDLLILVTPHIVDEGEVVRSVRPQ